MSIFNEEDNLHFKHRLIDELAEAAQSTIYQKLVELGYIFRSEEEYIKFLDERVAMGYDEETKIFLILLDKAIPLLKLDVSLRDPNHI